MNAVDADGMRSWGEVRALHSFTVAQLNSAPVLPPSARYAGDGDERANYRGVGNSGTGTSTFHNRCNTATSETNQYYRYPTLHANNQNPATTSLETSSVGPISQFELLRTHASLGLGSATYMRMAVVIWGRSVRLRKIADRSLALVWSGRVISQSHDVMRPDT